MNEAALSSPVNRVRLASMLDGISFVVLMGLGVPMKYLMGTPLLVRIIGPIHGLFFIWLCYELAGLVFGRKWPVKTGGTVFLVALIPLGPFFLDSWIKKQPLAEPAAQ